MTQVHLLEDVMVVVTLARAKKQLIIRREQEGLGHMARNKIHYVNINITS